MAETRGLPRHRRIQRATRFISISILTPAVRGTVMGLGWRWYTAALRALAEIVREEHGAKR